MVSMDAGALSLEEEDDNAAEDNDGGSVTGRGRHLRPPRRVAPAAHVLCGSRGAGIIKSKLLRRPAMAASSSSSHGR